MDKLQHRKAARTLVIKDAQGLPMKGQTIRATLKKHKFKFACGAFDTIPLMDPRTPEDKRELLQKNFESWHELCDIGIMPFYQGRYEPAKDQPRYEEYSRAVDLLLANGHIVKGHPLCWHTADARWLLPMSNAEVLENQLGRIRRDMTAFKGRVTIWDVINETVIMPEFDKTVNAITRLCQYMGRIPLIKALFEEARATDPTATLLINDFNTSDRYLHVIEDLLAAGVRPDAIGIQSHQHQGPWGAEKLAEVVARFSKLGIPLHFTENSMVSGTLMPPHIIDLNDWQVDSWPTTPEGEEQQARWILEMLDYLFEQPNVHVFTNWDYEDGKWLKAPTGMVREDGSLKPSYHAIYNRFHRDWHTDVTLQADENGVINLEGFKGEYELTCGDAKGKLTLDLGDEQIEVTLA